MPNKTKPTKKKWIIGVDIGGTKVLTTLLNSRYEIVATYKAKMEVHKGANFFLDLVSEGIDEVLELMGGRRDQIRCIGLGCPGLIQADGSISLSPNIPFLKNFPLAKKIRSRFRTHVSVANDVNAGLYGEQQFGAAAGADHVVGIFLGTGVGGAMILNGEIYLGARGGAGEIGHTFLNLPFIHDQKSGRKETVEGMLGRLRIASEAALLGMQQKVPTLSKAVGGDLRKIKTKTLKKSLQALDPGMVQLMTEKSEVLGIVLANIVNLLNPEKIVLGGGVIEGLGSFMIPIARQKMRQTALGPLVRGTRVVAASLGDYAVALGAAKLSEDTLKG